MATQRDSLNQTLRQIYVKAQQALSNEYERVEDLSGLHCIKIQKRFGEAIPRLMIVGQQTRGWYNERAGNVDALMDGYEEFDLGRGYYNSPFWVFSRWLSAGLNVEGDEWDFIWSNLYKVDQGQGALSDIELVSKLRSIALLPQELKIIKPSIVIFLTGPHYDQVLRDTFPDLEFEEIGNWERAELCLIQSDELPKKCLRAYHPNFIWRNGRTKEFRDAILSELA
jgi:hypothetical protein